MPTVFPVSNSDTGYVTGSSIVNLFINFQRGDSGQIENPFIRFPNFPLTKDEKISSARLVLVAQFTRSTSTSGLIYEVSGHKVSNSSTITSASDFNSRLSQKTDARFIWDMPNSVTANSSYYVFNISEIVEEIINQDGYQQNNAIQLLFEQQSGANGDRLQFYSVSGSGANQDVYLDILKGSSKVNSPNIYYVDTVNGSNSNNGVTSATPFQTLQYGYGQAAQYADSTYPRVINVKGSSETLSSNLSNTIDPANGTGLHIIGHGNSYGDGDKFSLDLSSRTLSQDLDFCSWKGVSFSRPFGGSVSFPKNLGNHDRWVFHDCDFSDFPVTGETLTFGIDCSFIRCRFKLNKRVSVGSNAMFHSCFFEANDVDVNTFIKVGDDSQFINCLFMAPLVSSSPAACIDTQSSNQISIQNCIFDLGGAGYTATTRVGNGFLIVNNIFMNCSSSVGPFGTVGGVPSVFCNNLFYGNTNNQMMDKSTMFEGNFIASKSPIVGDGERSYDNRFSYYAIGTYECARGGVGL